MADGTGVPITNFSKSFGDGRAFCAIMHGLFPGKIPRAALVEPANRRENFELAFRVAEEAGQMSMLDIDDCVSLPYPDSRAVMTYAPLSVHGSREAHSLLCVTSTNVRGASNRGACWSSTQTHRKRQSHCQPR